jgi:HAD superfamily hydrolase (TIGR01549 family)
MIKVLVFDFDGVIADSNRPKYEAWFQLFPASEGVSPELIKKVLDRVKFTRFDILRQIFTELKRPADKIEQLVKIYAEKYNRLAQAGIGKVGLFPEVPQVLEGLSKNYKLYLNSATPDEALAETVNKLGIARFFKQIFGISFASKEDNLRQITTKEKVAGEEIVFVGDADSDYRAAANCGCLFVGMVNEFNNWQNQNFPLISNLGELSEAIKRFA